MRYNTIGIDVDRYSKTSMDRLYAAGETACNGVHGRNRLASNSLLESLVFAKRAAKHIMDGYNHRYNLSDGILLKDNHIGAAGGVKEAVRMAKEYAPFVRKIEIEVENLNMLKEALEAVFNNKIVKNQKKL